MNAGLGDDRLFGRVGDDTMTGKSVIGKFSCFSRIDTIVDFKEWEDKIVGSDCEDVRLKSLPTETQSQPQTKKSVALESLLRWSIQSVMIQSLFKNFFDDYFVIIIR